MKRTLIAIVVMLVVVALPAGAYFFVQYRAQRTMETIRVAVEDLEGGTMRYGAVSASLFDGTMTVQEIVYLAPADEGRVTIAKAVLSGDEEVSVNADFRNVVYIHETESQHLDLGRLNVVGFDLTAFNTREKLTGAMLGEGLGNLVLDRLVATNFAAELRGEKFEVSTFRLEAVAEGVAKHLSLKDGSGSGKARGGEQVDLRIKSVVFGGLDFRTFQGGASDGRPGAAILDFLQRARFASFATDDLKADVDELKSSVVRFEVKNAANGVVDMIGFSDAVMKGKHKNEPLSVSVAALKVDRLDLTSLRQAAAETTDQLTGKMFLHRVKIGEFLLEKVAIDVDPEELAVGKFHLSGLTDGVVERLAVNGARIANLPDEKVREVGFDNLTIGNLDFKIDYANEEKLLALMQDYLGITEGQLSGIRVVGADDSVVSVKRIGIVDIARERGFVVSGRAFIDSLELPLDSIAAQNPDAARFLSAFDDKIFRFNAGATFNYDIAAGDLKEALALSADGMGKLSMDFHVVGFDHDTYRRFMTGKILPSEWLQRQDVRFALVALRYDDDKLADTIVDMLSQGNRRQFAAQMAQNLASAYPEPRFRQQATGAVTNFLTGANRFHVVARPAAPVAIPAVMQAFQNGTLVPLLNLQILGN